ncbi:MAG: arylsulfatase [Oscillospiraceae bacterium]|nr:arylsulfatase [Oscillospiraceae bacterium]
MSKRKFVGTVGRTVVDTDYKFETAESRLKASPNVVYIVLDDLGFAGLGCYGSNINTPNIDRLAAEGLRYNNFHTTAVCSATRASLLTGANHHEAGVASVVEFQTGTENGQGCIDPAYATLAEILREYDYSTFAAGKWHLSQYQTDSGPYDNWPLGKGFERYYGFISAETDQYHPFSLTRDNSFIPQPKEPKDGYHLSVDITDNAIDFIYNQKNSFPDKPFFLYLAYGAMHTPHHAPKEYIERYKGKFDMGWDKAREGWFENQKRLGIIPQNTELTDRAPLVEPWDSLDSDHKKFYSRYMETFAGFLEHTDEQIGRVIDFLKSIDQFDNTIIVLLSDNGASAEGGIEGRFNAFSGQDITTRTGEAEFALEHIDEIGGEYSFNHYPTGWANALNTPFQWYKIWSHEGGIKDPLIISYPKLISDKGGIRSQYHHVSDITPTVLDILGVQKPGFIKGVPQKPFSGTSLKYTFDADSSESRKKVQYYETFGNRAIYKDGWKAVVNHAFSETYEEDEWELYHTAEDYSEKHNVADKYPEKLRELQEEFFLEAGRHNVFPMLKFPFHAAPEKIMQLFGEVRIPETERTYKNIFKPYMLNMRVNSGASLWISAEINRKDTSDEGILFSQGDRFGGLVLYIKDNRLKFVYNANRFEYFEAVSHELPTGRLTVRLDYDVVPSGEINAVLYVNGSESGRVTVTRRFYTPGMSSSLRASLYTEVSPDYTGRFEFTGDIDSITIHQYGTALKKQDVIEKIMNAD